MRPTFAVLAAFLTAACLALSVWLAWHAVHLDGTAFDVLGAAVFLIAAVLLGSMALVGVLHAWAES